MKEIVLNDCKDSNFLIFNKKLATILGLNEVIVLSQINHSIEINKTLYHSNEFFKEGHYWTLRSIEVLKEELPFWSSHTIKRTIKRLEEKEILISKNLNTNTFYRAKWYRINYSALDKIC